MPDPPASAESTKAPEPAYPCKSIAEPTPVAATTSLAKRSKAVVLEPKF